MNLVVFKTYSMGDDLQGIDDQYPVFVNEFDTPEQAKNFRHQLETELMWHDLDVVKIATASDLH